MEDHKRHDSTVKLQGDSIFSSKTLGICLIILVVSLVALFIFKIPFNTLLIGGIFLACPLMHFWMMKDSNHKH